MAAINVNPTRMELKKLKAKLLTARRGHKLLKDKCDELMRQFLITVRETKDLSASLTGKLSGVTSQFRIASAYTDNKMMTEALMLPSFESEISISTDNIMSVRVPVFSMDEEKNIRKSDAGYGYAFTTGEIDTAADTVAQLAPELIKLAEMEKKCQLLSAEIERTRRRVNALENIMIPQYEETIKYISMKLDENERSNTSRLMKVKDMMLEEKLRKK